jgi:hypothetical protein
MLEAGGRIEQSCNLVPAQHHGQGTRMRHPDHLACQVRPVDRAEGRRRTAPPYPDPRPTSPIRLSAHCGHSRGPGRLAELVSGTRCHRVTRMQTFARVCRSPPVLPSEWAPLLPAADSRHSSPSRIVLRHGHAFSLVSNAQAGGLGSLRCDFAIESHYAVAPGLAGTVSYQDLSARLSAGTGMLSARVTKSTATSA